MEVRANLPNVHARQLVVQQAQSVALISIIKRRNPIWCKILKLIYFHALLDIFSWIEWTGALVWLADKIMKNITMTRLHAPIDVHQFLQRKDFDAWPAIYEAMYCQERDIFGQLAISREWEDQIPECVLVLSRVSTTVTVLVLAWLRSTIRKHSTGETDSKKIWKVLIEMRRLVMWFDVSRRRRKLTLLQ